MKDGQVALAASDIIQAMKAQGFIDTTGEFVLTKFEDIPSVSALAAAVVPILANYGVKIPAEVPKVIAALPSIVAALPLLESILGAFK